MRSAMLLAALLSAVAIFGNDRPRAREAGVIGGIEATEEAIYNSLFRATSVRDVEALPLERVLPMLK